ncbi:hypothetical protein PAMA_017298 [Pampus argenteus]
MAAHLRKVNRRRSNITALPLYYSGYLMKKQNKDKDFKRYYGELRGATLFLYSDDTQDTYTEKLDLERLMSMNLVSPYQKKTPTTFTLKMPTDEVQLKMENADKGEEWRAYILTVVRKEIPSNLQMLPGQTLQLKDTLAQEKRRNLAGEYPPIPPRPDFLLSASSSPPSSSSSLSPLKDNPKDSSPMMPSCYFNVNRQDAEKMLTANPECGSIILRPSTMANNYALTLRQPTSSGHVLRNYRVSRTNSGFIINLEPPVSVSCLDEVLKYFFDRTDYRLQPYKESQPYAVLIEASPVPECVTSSAKTVPKAHVAPMKQNKAKTQTVPAKPEEGDYVVAEDHTPDEIGLKPSLNEKHVELTNELRHVLHIRKQNIYTVTGEDTANDCETTGHSNTVQWLK